MEYLKNESMQNHTTFRIGGPADYFCAPETLKELQEVIRGCREKQYPFTVIGNGSNLLVSDAGYRGMIVQLYRNLSDIRVEKETITAQAGALLSSIAKRAAKHSLSGFEFAGGIPGTLGGACVMNAGAYGGEMKDVLLSVRVLTPDNEIREVKADELDLGYRHSVIPEKGWIVLEAKIGLHKGDSAAINARMEELRQRRQEKQPLDVPSAGSTFKRPEGYFAGKLISDAGLRGFSVGGAQVSEKHCGFVINTGNATAADVLELIRQVRERVHETSGVWLEPEIRILGEEQ